VSAHQSVRPPCIGGRHKRVLRSTVAHVDALQIEYSAFCLDNEHNGLISTAKELGVTIIAFSPLGAGFLTGRYTDASQFTDMR
jgi:aryl-alcohol dehydrogenase-like predicted oxidoreductase